MTKVNGFNDCYIHGAYDYLAQVCPKCVPAPTIKAVPVILLSEHEALLREERAKAFEEAAQALTGSEWIHLEVVQDFAAAFCGEAAAARTEKEGK